MEKILKMFRIKLLVLSILLTVLALNIDAYGFGSGRKNIKRDVDYVVVPGKKLANNLKKDIKNMALYVSTVGSVRPIPFQIDEVNTKGSYVLTDIPPGGLADEDLTPEVDDDNGLLDENDQLVFMISDSGDQISDKNKLPEDAEAIDEITLVDPIKKGKAWVYLCYLKEKSSPAEEDYEDYIRYQFPHNLLISKSYVIGFSKELPLLPNYLTIRDSKNIIDRIKVRMDTSTLLIPYSIDEEDFSSKMSLYRDGPVRVIRRTSTAITFLGIFKTPYLAVEMLSYDRFTVLPFTINVPLDVKSYRGIMSILIRAGVYFNNIKGWRFKTNVTKKWIEINGKMDPAEKILSGSDLSWFILNDKERALLVRLILDRKQDGSYQKTPLMPRLYYVDDDKAEDPPENVPGQSPNIMYQLDGVENLTKRKLHFCTFFYIIDEYRDGQEANYLKIIDNPIEVYTRGN